MANAFHYSVGRKFIQAVSGAFLILFLIIHATVNFFSVIDTFTGKYGVVAADTRLFTSGDGLFKLGCDFMSTPIITIIVPILALGFLIHIFYGIYLTWYNIRARGGYKRYEVRSRAQVDSWSAKNMFVLGIVILGFLFFHLTHFWAQMQLKDFMGAESANDPYLLLDKVFGNFWVLAIYLIWFCAIFLHLTHGFWSMFQSVGWNNQTWLKRLKVIGAIVAAIICLAFVAVAVNAYLHANGILPDIM